MIIAKIYVITFIMPIQENPSSNYKEKNIREGLAAVIGNKLCEVIKKKRAQRAEYEPWLPLAPKCQGKFVEGCINRTIPCNTVKPSTIDLKTNDAYNLELVNDNIPHEFMCPISLTVMKEPVIISCGHSFDDINLRSWIQNGHSLCPVCNFKLDGDKIYMNYALKSIIEREIQNILRKHNRS